MIHTFMDSDDQEWIDVIKFTAYAESINNDPKNDTYLCNIGVGEEGERWAISLPKNRD